METEKDQEGAWKTSKLTVFRGQSDIGRLYGGSRTSKCIIGHIGRLCCVIDEVQRPSSAEMYLARDHTSDMTTTAGGGSHEQHHMLRIFRRPYPTSVSDESGIHRLVV